MPNVLAISGCPIINKPPAATSANRKRTRVVLVREHRDAIELLLPTTWAAREHFRIPHPKIIHALCTLSHDHLLNRDALTIPQQNLRPLPSARDHNGPTMSSLSLSSSFSTSPAMRYHIPGFHPSPTADCTVQWPSIAPSVPWITSTSASAGAISL